MNMKSFLVSGIAGGITDFLLGWLLYGMLFRDYFGGGEPNLGLIFAGCLSFGFLMSYIFVRLSNIVSLSAGLMAGGVIGLIMGMMHNFFQWAMEAAVDWQKFAIDVVIGIIMGAVVGAVVGAVNG